MAKNSALGTLGAYGVVMFYKHREFWVQIVVSTIIGLLIFSVGELILMGQIDNRSVREQADITEKYLTLQQRVAFMSLENLSLIRGIAAYIQMNQTYTDEEMMQLLEIIYKDRLTEVRNVGIVEDTTMRWVYPLEGNESVLGVDFSKVEGQKEGILAVKNTLQPSMFGPVDLVQGGRGFIIRIPILKNDTYWGMASVVLNIDNAFDFISEFEKSQHVRVLLTYADKPDQIIYGDVNIEDMNPMHFGADTEMALWDTYMIPEEGWSDDSIITLYLSVTILGVAMLIAYRFYIWLSNYISIINANKDMKYLSYKDPFTGISNRGHLDLCVAEEVEHSDRNGHPISMIYFDLDKFKSINDTYGHAQGDVVLLSITKRVSELLDSHHVFARWGGDEFIILMPNARYDEALLLSEKIRDAIRSVTYGDGETVTCSTGVSERVQYEFWESWFRRTDRALYDSKQNGRDCVTVSDHEHNPKIQKRILWLKIWNSGIDIIDNAHLRATEMCNSLVISSFDETRIDETIRLAEQLMTEINKHFNEEIAYLHMIGYPEAHEHALIHDRLFELTQELLSSLKDGKMDSDTLLTFLRDVVIHGHLVQVDQKYRAFL